MLPRRKLGEMLVVRGLVSGEQLETGLKWQSTHGGRIGSIFVSLGYLAEDELLRFLSLAYDVPQIDLRHFEASHDATDLLAPALARGCMMAPVKIVQRPPDAPVLIVATPDPTDWDSIEKVRQATGCLIEPYVCSFGQFEEFFQRAYRDCEDPDSLDQMLACHETSEIVCGLVRTLIAKKLVTTTELRVALEDAKKGPVH